MGLHLLTFLKMMTALTAVGVGFFSAHFFNSEPVPPPEIRISEPLKNHNPIASKHLSKPKKRSVSTPNKKKDSVKPAQDFKNGLVISGKTPHRLILFTFDDGPDLKNTPRLLDTLDEHNIKAVFFLTTERFERKSPKQQKRAELAKEIARRGHFIGNHTSTHPQLPLLSNQQIFDEIENSAKVLKRVLGKQPWLFRPPGGARSFRTDKIVEKQGYTQMLWNLGAGDFQVETAAQVLQTWKKVFDRRTREVGDQGGIVLLHDTHAWSVEAVPLLVEEIHTRNCALLKQDEELFDIVDDPSFFYMERGHADWGTESPPVFLEPEILHQRQQNIRAKLLKSCS